MSRASDSLRCRIQRIVAAGGYYDADNADEGHTIDRALLAYAGVMTKAVAVALLGAESVSCADHGVDVEFSQEDAARALCGLSALLSEAAHLSYDLDVARDRASAEAAE